MAQVEIYTTNYCPYCAKAKQLLDKKGTLYTEIDVTNDSAEREALIEKSFGRRTVPQIFINGVHVGGCDDLYGLEEKGELDRLLA